MDKFPLKNYSRDFFLSQQINNLGIKSESGLKRDSKALSKNRWFVLKVNSFKTTLQHKTILQKASLFLNNHYFEIMWTILGPKFIPRNILPQLDMALSKMSVKGIQKHN